MREEIDPNTPHDIMLGSTQSTISTVWMAALTLVVFIMIAINFKRWRLDYCSRTQTRCDDNFDALSATSISIRDDTNSICGADNKGFLKNNLYMISSSQNGSNSVPIGGACATQQRL